MHRCYRSTVHFWLAMTISAVLFVPTRTYAQRCTGNIQVGCLTPGAACSPVDVGSGASGRCTTSAVLPRGERECNCVGTPLPPPPPPLYKDFDVVSSLWDANHFPLNPKWGLQVYNNNLPDPVVSCPPDSTNTSDWTSAPHCTSYPVTFNGASGIPCGHHVNFMPVTYEGTAVWKGGPTLWPFGDQDYTFNVTRDDAALYSTAGHHVHTEFDATETVNNWDGTGTWWEKFHHDGADKGDYSAGQMINGDYVMVIGLLGLDEYSGIGHSQSGKGKTELHPAYAMFVLVNKNLRLRKNTWAFFVRNWGNEGYCGGDQENMFAQTMRIQIPHVRGIGPQGELVGKTALVAENVWEGARNTDNLQAMSAAAQPDGGGMLLTFRLLTPDKQSWFMGDITFQETPPGLTNHPEEEMHGTARPEEGFPAEFEALRARVNKLPKSVQQQLLVQQQSVVPTKQGKRASVTIIAEPTQPRKINSRRTVVRGDLVRPSKDSVGELNRSKQLEILKKSLAK